MIDSSKFEDLRKLCTIMREVGVVEFECDGFKARLGPTMTPDQPTFDDDPELAKVKLQSALENFKQASKDYDEETLNWST